MTVSGMVDGLQTSGESVARKVAPKLKLTGLTVVTRKGARDI